MENSKIGVTKKIIDFSKLDCSTSSYHNSTNTGLIDMFFTKKYNYFSRATRWNHPFLSQPPLKGCFGTLKLTDGFIWPILYTHKWRKFSSLLKSLIQIYYWGLYQKPYLSNIYNLYLLAMSQITDKYNMFMAKFLCDK